MVQNLRLVLRQLRHSPGFTATVVVTLGFSIGVNTAIFSVVDALLLKQLPYSHPERIGTIFERTMGSDAADERRNIDGEQWELLRDNVPSLLSAISSLRPSGVNLQSGSHVEYLQAGRVSAHYFDVLSLHPILGRTFSEDEDRPHGPKAVVLSYSLWRTVFNADPDVIGQGALLKGEPYTVIGVLPRGASAPLNVDLYTALQATRDGEGQATNFLPIVRLRDGATWPEANAEINRALAHTQRVQFILSKNPGSQITFHSVPLQQGQTSRLKPQVLGLMLAAGLILLIACANLAGLTLVRMLRRTSEIATRLALGASAWQVQKQLWIENAVLALIGGVAGIAVGFVSLRGLLLLLPQHFLPVANVHLDARVLGFTLVLSLLTSVLFGMLPAFSTRKIDLRSAMGSRAIAGYGSFRVRQGLIAGEVALTLLLLSAAGLLVRTLVHLETMSPGFNPNGVITAKASLDDVRYHDPATFRKLLDESLGAVRQIPGIKDAAVGLTLPYERPLLDGVSLNDGTEAGRQLTTNRIYVTPGYFETLQIPVLLGRGFSAADGPDAQPVVIVNQTFARRFYHGASPVGRHVNHMLIVGVVGDTVISSAARLHDDSEPLTDEETIYVPAAQLTDAKSLAIMHTWFQPSWIVRSAASTETVIPQMQQALARVDPNLPFSGFYSMHDLMAATLASQRVEVALLTTMASLALILSAIGIFALVANMVVQRRREIGIRIALGSTIERAMLQVGQSSLGAAAVGLGAGLMLCAAALPAMRNVLYGVRSYDPKTLVLVLLTLGIVTLLATAVPALRIVSIDPAKTLRDE